ncbi:hypothetical protein P0D69_42690 [Paraburkholderia sediminicola]|uniref:hypothetical protein n=1 Tax=Paraburkholderia sediminicola TaxID=458836 RepID=UPI0038B74CF0
MNRQFLTESTDPSTQSQPANQHAPGAQSSGQLTSERSFNEALAGAFPEWDLLPATPFVRRVK